jgi:hypothetical protein
MPATAGFHRAEAKDELLARFFLFSNYKAPVGAHSFAKQAEVLP